MGTSRNRVIRFHQFSIADDRCAMKVGTDALLLGAWAGRHWGTEEPLRVLEIGAGSGIVSLMLAQRFPNAQFVGIEIEENAAQQASENVRASPFRDRVDIVHADFLNWAGAFAATKWDWVVSNPPFFKNKPKSPDPARNLARHEDAMPLVQWMPAATRLLDARGVVSLVWPLERLADWNEMVQTTGFSPLSTLWIRGSSQQPPERGVLEIARDVSRAAEHFLSIDDLPVSQTGGIAVRTHEYKDLVRPFLIHV
jgi:tRNA1Val (adenine37-N6)-methyltransferase